MSDVTQADLEALKAQLGSDIANLVLETIVLRRQIRERDEQIGRLSGALDELRQAADKTPTRRRLGADSANDGGG